MDWRTKYLRNRIAALDIIIADRESTVPKAFAIKQRKDAFKNLIDYQLANFNKE